MCSIRYPAFYSGISIKRTPFVPRKSVRFNEVSALWRVRMKINPLNKYGSKTGIYGIRVHHGLSGNEKGINTADLRF